MFTIRCSTPNPEARKTNSPETQTNLNLLSHPIPITPPSHPVVMKPTPRRRSRRIVSRTPHDLVPRFHQKLTVICRLQKPPIAKMRKQVHKQLPCLRAQRELDVVVFDALHQQVEGGFGLGLGGGGDEGDNRIESGVAEVGVLEFGAEEVGFDEEGEGGLRGWLWASRGFGRWVW